MSTEVRLWLPWPDVKLNPNNRCHWRVKRLAVARYRENCTDCVERQITRDVRAFARQVARTGEQIDMALRFDPPTRRRPDRDNLSAAAKAGIDGLCSVLGFDDALVDTLTVSVGERWRVSARNALLWGHGRVIVRLARS